MSCIYSQLRKTILATGGSSKDWTYHRNHNWRYRDDRDTKRVIYIRWTASKYANSHLWKISCTSFLSHKLA